MTSVSSSEYDDILWVFLAQINTNGLWDGVWEEKNRVQKRLAFFFGGIKRNIWF